MSKRKQDIKVFTLDYLATAELTEDDLHYIFDCNALFYSLIKEMFVYTGELTNINLIAKNICSQKDWMNRRHFKSFSDQRKFKNKAAKCVRNVYQYSKEQSKRWVESFMTKYGFSIGTNSCLI